jgi:RHS repeat-associated protein
LGQDYRKYDMTNAGGYVDQLNYDAYGNITYNATPSATGILGYAGYQIDVSIGLYYVNARWYNPQTQQWMQIDPAGFTAGDENLRRYVANHPTNGTDSSGLEWVDTGKTKEAERIIVQRWTRVAPGKDGRIGHWRRDPNGKFADFTFVAPPHPLASTGLFQYVLDERQPTVVNFRPIDHPPSHFAKEQVWKGDDLPPPPPVPVVDAVRERVRYIHPDEPTLDPILVGATVVGTIIAFTPVGRAAKIGLAAVGIVGGWLGLGSSEGQAAESESMVRLTPEQKKSWDEACERCRKQQEWETKYDVPRRIESWERRGELPGDPGRLR